MGVKAVKEKKKGEGGGEGSREKQALTGDIMRCAEFEDRAEPDDGYNGIAGI